MCSGIRVSRLCWKVAEREGFEPSVPFPEHILSRDAQSATLSPLLMEGTNPLSELLKVNINQPFPFVFKALMAERLIREIDAKEATVSFML